MMREAVFKDDMWISNYGSRARRDAKIDSDWDFLILVDGLAEKLKLSKDAFAFYTALEINDSAAKVLGDETLRNIAREIAEKVRKNATIDWAMKESARAKLMVIVRRTLNQYGYPPDKQQKTVDTVLKQAEVPADYRVEHHSKLHQLKLGQVLYNLWRRACGTTLL